LSEPGAVEVAGPSTADDVRAVAERMLALGAEQVLIDGAIDRRAASSPAVADGLVMATGAILGEDIDDVVARTSDAVDLVRLPAVAERDEQRPGASDSEQSITLERRLVLNAEPPEIAVLLRGHPDVSSFVIEGALGERFLEGLLTARRERAKRALKLIVGDPTKVFLSRHGPRWYQRQGLSIEVLRSIELKAITVNPLAPQSHHFDSHMLCELIATAVPDVPVLDVLAPA
ncbi:MAG: hypothetical protein WB709_05010, partial [Solirubrobacteraceae bacterium]